jgi:thioredoxin reductase
MSYPTVAIHNCRVTKLKGVQDDFQVTFGKNETVTARRIIVATGVIDMLESIPGLAECWGTSVIHCPYCHGYEFNDQPTGYLNNSPTVHFFSKMLLNWTKSLTVLTNGPAVFNLEEFNKVEVLLDERVIVELRQNEGFLQEAVFASGDTIPLKALYYHPPFRLGSESIVGFAPELTENGHIKVDKEQRTSVPGVFAVGDCSTGMRSVAMSVAAGGLAGAMTNHDLI